MKSIFRSLAIGLLTLSMVLPAAEISAQGRRDHNNGGREQSGRSGQRRGSENRSSGDNSRPSRGNGNSNNRRPSASNHSDKDKKDKNHATRPGQNVRPGNSNSGHNRPAGNHPGQNVRPGNDNHNRPSGSRPNTGLRPNRPSHGNPPVYRPQVNHRPNHGHSYRPEPPHGMVHHHWGAPPHRPHRPVPRPWSRPLPPPSFRPHYHITPLQAIIGVALGTALDISLNTLSLRNYSIDGYADNRVYLRNVDAMNYMWPDATLYYNNGYLVSSTFSYSTSFYDVSRYNSLYMNLTGLYGAPASRRNIDSGWSATWWGYDNRYITIEFQPLYTASGGIRYYTTLVMGD